MIEIATGAVIGVAYMTAGIGTARAASRIADRDFRLFDVFFWPIALCVMAATGETS